MGGGLKLILLATHLHLDFTVVKQRTQLNEEYVESTQSYIPVLDFGPVMYPGDEAEL